MRILFLTGRETSYARNDVLLRAFRRFAEVDVVGEHARGGILRRSLTLPLQAFARLRSLRYDLIFVGFFGQALMPAVSRRARAPILFDAFVSAWDTLTGDRARFGPRSLPGRLAFRLDQSACNRAAHILLDTPLHVQFFADTFRLPHAKISAIPVGCNEDLFHPQPAETTRTVLYYTSYQPLHGAETVVRAAALAPEAQFKIIGDGQTAGAARQLAGQLGIRNIQFAAPIPLDRLPGEIASAAVCLGGHFGTSDKAGRVIPGKIYQIMAMARPLIAGDTPANRDLLGDEAAIFVKPADPAGLAASIQQILRDPEEGRRLARGGRAVYKARASEQVITSQLRRIVEGMLTP